MVSLVLSNTKWIYGRILQNRLITCMSCTTYNTSTTKSKKMGTLSSQKGSSSEETNQFYKCHVLSKWSKTKWLQRSLNVYITVMDIIWRARPGSWFNSSLKLPSTSPICFSMYSFEVCQKHRTSIYFHQSPEEKISFIVFIIYHANVTKKQFASWTWVQATNQKQKTISCFV